MKQRPQDQPLGWGAGRRKRAFELHAQGGSQRRIARALGVSQAAVSRWLASGRWQGSAPERRGSKAKLDAKSLWQLPDLLSHGAQTWSGGGAARCAVRSGSRSLSPHADLLVRVDGLHGLELFLQAAIAEGCQLRVFFPPWLWGATLSLAPSWPRTQRWKWE